MLLLLVDYKNAHANSYIGRLDRFLKIKNSDNKRDEELREVGDLTLDLAPLKAALIQRQHRIEGVRFAWDKRLLLSESPATNSTGQLTFLECPAAQLEFE